MQRVEVGNAILVEDNHLAVEHEMLVAQLQRTETISGKCLGQSYPADQRHAVLLANEHHAVAVVLDLVDPLRASAHIT
ncbi:MAG: hypothetical protein J2P54_17455 [Bradyrhizobiaceae bacterium]|nr:hypothetical protein [Bradyrhizobiaceae bacterium]